MSRAERASSLLALLGRPGRLTGLFLASILAACSSHTQLPETPPRGPLAVAERPQLIQSSPVLLTVPEQYTPTFVGQALVDTGDQQGSAMMYPGYNAAGFLAAIATHAAIANSLNNSKQEARLKAANRVLETFEEEIDTIDTSYLLFPEHYNSATNSIDRPLIVTEATGQPSWHLSMQPSFIVTRKAHELILANHITITNPFDADDTKADYQKIIVVQSQAFHDYVDQLDEEDASGFFSAVKDTLNASIALALEDRAGRLSTPAEQKMVTIRYRQNDKKAVERGRLLRHDCTALVFESLRGEIKSVPAQVWTEGCAESTH